MEHPNDFQRLLRRRDTVHLPGEMARGAASPARHRRQRRSRGRRLTWRDGALTLAAAAAAGLMLGLAPAGPDSVDPTYPAPPVDPWARSRESLAILAPQEAAPTSLVDDRGRLLGSSTPYAEAPGRRVRFTLCHSGGGIDCVVDGDTFWMAGEKIRVADIDTPETHPPRCAAEARAGAAATARLRTLLDAGPFELAAIDRDTDRYGRKLRIVRRGGRSLGEVMIAEGLARPYRGGPRAGWC